MTGPEKQMDDNSLDALFADMARDRPQPSDALLSRIVADAEVSQPVQELKLRQSRGFLAQISDALGGWAGLGGLATATVAGIYIGFVQPDLVGLQAVAVEIEESEFIDTALWPDDDLFFDEG